MAYIIEHCQKSAVGHLHIAGGTNDPSHSAHKASGPSVAASLAQQEEACACCKQACKGPPEGDRAVQLPACASATSCPAFSLAGAMSA